LSRSLSLSLSLSLSVSACVSLPPLHPHQKLFRLLCACTASQTEYCIDSKMAKTRLACLLTLLSTHCYFSVLAVVLRTSDESPWTNEFDKIELSCLIESISTTNPRIEWKKITSEGPSYVYFDKKISGDLENRAVIREPATLLITNATRSDTAKYRCEVTAADDLKSFDEIVINLIVRVKPVVPKCSVPKSVPFGKSAELSCVEDEGFPKSQYQWFKNNEEIPDDPKTSLKFSNSSYTLNADTGTLKFIAVRKEDGGDYFCRAKNDAGFSQCPAQPMEVYDIDVLGIALGVLVVVIVLLCITVGICCAYKRGFFSSEKQTGNNYKVPAKGDGVDYVRTEDEGDFRHKSSFVI
ncbi:junctional adhesion molecule 3B, partial [Acanthopagrus latus]|uniref:junctional adhesion molecule 3B n=1 Tax=Acanthopagrus latus TaxID=8177 RepID=UPI00187C9B96